MGYAIRFQCNGANPDASLQQLAVSAITGGGYPAFRVWVDGSDRVVMDCPTDSFDEALALAKRMTNRIPGGFAGGDLELEQVTEKWPVRVPPPAPSSPLGY